MKEEKLSAIKLRKNGQSYNQISVELGIAKSTLNYWLKDVKLSNQAKEKINARVHKTSVAALIKRNKMQTVLAAERAQKIVNLAKKEAAELMKDKLFVAGICLYWAEGYKKGAFGSKWKSVDFANSDPIMVKLMMRFFRKFCGVIDEKIKVQLLAHNNLILEEAIKYWSQLMRLPQNQFIKTCYSLSKYSKGKRDRNTLAYGTVHIRINDVKVFFRVIGWIEGLKQYFKI